MVEDGTCFLKEGWVRKETARLSTDPGARARTDEAEEGARVPAH